MTKVHEFPELTSLDGDERLYIVDDPNGTPANAYVDIATLDGRWAASTGSYEVSAVTAGASVTLDGSAPAYTLDMDQNTVISFPTVTGGFAFLLQLSGAFSPTFPAAVVEAPSYTNATLYAVHTLDGGTNWFMSAIAEGVTLA